MVVCESVAVIINMCEVCECKYVSISDASETKRVIVVHTFEADTLVFKTCCM